MKKILPWAYTATYLFTFVVYTFLGEITGMIFWGVMFLALLMLALKEI